MFIDKQVKLLFDHKVNNKIIQIVLTPFKIVNLFNVMTQFQTLAATKGILKFTWKHLCWSPFLTESLY